MSAGSIFETAISLATQAVSQDKAKNYPEAARCYREAIATFASVRGKCATPQVAAAVDSKISEYRDRLRKLDHYLLSKADLSNLFRSAVEYHCDSQTSHTSQCTSIQRGIQLIERAKRKDKERSFGEALSLYEQGSAELLKVAIKAQQDGRLDQSDKIRFKCLLIHERVDEIRNALDHGRDVKDRREVTNSSSFGVPSGEVSSSSSLKNRGSRAGGGGFDSCSASPEPTGLNMPVSGVAGNLMSMASVATSINEDNESRVFLMDEVRSSIHSLAAAAVIARSVSTTEIPLSSSNNGRHSSLKGDLKRSPSLNSDFGGSNSSAGRSASSTSDLIPLANMDQELCLSDDDEDEAAADENGAEVESVCSYSQAVRRMVGVKTTDPSVASSNCSLNRHRYRSFHLSAENVLAAYGSSSLQQLQTSAASGQLAETTSLEDSCLERDRNVTELVSTSHIIKSSSDDLDTSSSLPMLNTSCESEEEELGSGGVLNDSGSDSGISNPCTSTWKRVGGGGGDATPSPDSPTLIEELVTSVVEDVVANAQLISSAATDSNSCSLHLEDDETAPLISNSETVLPVEAVVIHQNPSKSPPPECLEVVQVEVESHSSVTPSPSPSRTSINSVKGRSSCNSNGSSATAVSHSNSLRKASTLKKQSASIDELRVLSSEDVVDHRPMARKAAVASGATLPKVSPKSVRVSKAPTAPSATHDDFYYGKPEAAAANRRTEYVPPRAFAAHPDFQDESLANKGCYYFLSCLDAFWIL